MSLTLTLVAATLAALIWRPPAYAFARLRFPGRQVLLFWFIATHAVPKFTPAWFHHHGVLATGAGRQLLRGMVLVQMPLPLLFMIRVPASPCFCRPAGSQGHAPSHEDLAILKVNRLTRAFDTTSAVQDASFRVEKGEMVALPGPSGSGKSTPLRMFNGVTPLDARTFAFSRQNLTERQANKRLTGGSRSVRCLCGRSVRSAMVCTPA